MNMNSIGRLAAVALTSILLTGCAGMGNTLTVKHYESKQSNEAGKLGETNVTMSGKPGQFVMHAVAGEDFYKMLAEKGGSEDKGGGTQLDLWDAAAGASGSFFGKRVNNVMKITVASKEFEPRVLVLERVSSPSMSNQLLIDGKYFQAVSADVVTRTSGNNIVVTKYTDPKDMKRGDDSIYSKVIGVQSADGRSGAYSIKVEFLSE